MILALLMTWVAAAGKVDGDGDRIADEILNSPFKRP